MSTTVEQSAEQLLTDERVAFVGRLAGMPRKKAQQLAREHGATVTPDLAGATLIVVGEDQSPLGTEDSLDAILDADVRHAAEQGDVEVVAETQFWQRLGLIEGEQHIRRLYTTAMLADLLDVPVAVVRRWHRRRLIVPVREVHRLAYFDFQEVATARRLSELLANGVSAEKIEHKLGELARLLPHVERPLAQLPVIVEGRDLLLRSGDGLIDGAGQRRLDFDAEDQPDDEPAAQTSIPLDPIARLRLAAPSSALSSPVTPEELLEAALEREDIGQLPEAAELYRTLLLVEGPSADACFHLAEVLYRQGELSAARERYLMAVELDETFVEARCNLGCVLAEAGELELAAAALEGALAVHPNYPDAHYHLARVLDDAGAAEQAEVHWHQFLGLVPEGPWADEARQRLTEPV